MNSRFEVSATLFFVFSGQILLSFSNLNSNRNETVTDWVPLIPSIDDRQFFSNTRRTGNSGSGNSVAKRWTKEIADGGGFASEFSNVNNGQLPLPANDGNSQGFSSTLDDSSYFPTRETGSCRKNLLTIYLQRSKCSYTLSLNRNLELNVKSFVRYGESILQSTVCVLQVYSVGSTPNNVAISFVPNERKGYDRRNDDFTSSTYSAHDLQWLLRSVKLFSVIEGTVSRLSYQNALKYNGPSLVLSNGTSILVSVLIDGMVNFAMDVFTYMPTINNINQKEIFVLQTAVIVAINFFYLISTVYTKYDAAWTVYTKYGVPPAPQLHWYLYPCHSTFWIPRSTAANNFTQDWITYIFETSPYKNEGECIFIFEGDQNEKLNFQLEDLKIYVNVTTSKECMKLYSVEKTADIKFLFSICNSEIHGNNIITGNFTTNANIGIITTTIEYGYFRIKVRSMYEKNENQTSSSTTELTTLANNLTTVSTAATDTDSTSTEADSIKRP